MSRPVTVHSSILPSNRPTIHEPARFPPAPSARLCWCLGDVGGDAPGHHQGEIAPRGYGATSVIHVCKWRDIQTTRILCMHKCMCLLCACVLCVFVPHTCILTLRGFGCQRKESTGRSAVQRRAEKRGSHNKAPRGSLCMQHSSGETWHIRRIWYRSGPWGELLARPGSLVHSSRARIAYPYRVLLRTNSRLCPSSREP